MKPIVTYKDVYPATPEVGSVAFVIDVEGHPAQPIVNSETGERGNYARTSMVERVGENGEFETKNTIYRKRA